MFLLKNKGTLKIAIDKNPKMAKIGWYLTIIKLALKIISTLVFKLNQI
jgi:hypothetical protein